MNIEVIDIILTQEQQLEIINILKLRFENNMNRHPHIDWKMLEDKLKTNPQKLWSLYEMDRTGGEPDIIEYDEKTNEYVFYDCSK